MTSQDKFTNFVNNLLALLLILFSSRANYIVNEPPGLFAAFILFLMITIYRRISVGKNFFIILIILIIFYIAYYFRFNELTPGFYTRYIAIILMSYLALKLLGKSLFYRVEKIMFVLILISFPFYILDIFYHNQLFSLIQSTQRLLGISTSLSEKIDYANIIIYTARPEAELFRNSGFMWEPGPFGVMIVLSMLIYLFTNDFKLSPRVLIYLVALVTTISTTGYIMVLVVMLLYLTNKQRYRKVLIFPVLLALGFVIWSQDFVGEKIIELAADPEEKLEASYNTKIKSQTQSLGRFAGLLYNIENLKINPLFGVGGNEEVLYRRQNIYYYSTNGLGHYLMIFGILGTIIMLFNLIKTSRQISKDFNFKGWYFLLLVYLTAGFGFIVVFTPLFYIFQLYYLAIPRNRSLLLKQNSAVF